MSAESVARALGGAYREGRNWRCRCPLHGGVSLVLAYGDAGRLLVKCWGGCNSREVLSELHRRGLFSVGRDDTPREPKRRDDRSRSERALRIWHEARPILGTIAERYLAYRSLQFAEISCRLRFHPQCRRPKDKAGNFRRPLPAMIGLVEHTIHGPVAVHCTYLRADGTGKADIAKEEQKAFFGPVCGGAVRLSPVRTNEWLVTSEGIETCLSVMGACSLPGFAALSAGGLKSLILPPEANLVLICADSDRNGVGQRAANHAAQRFLAEGRRVRVALPALGEDFNDMLTSAAALSLEEARDVA